MTRWKRYQLIMYLTGLTMFVFYGLQGFYIHGSPNDVDPWVWILESVFWAFRAIVEASAIAYLNETRPNNWFEGFLIVVFDFLLIGLIMLTGSVVIQASATGQSPYELLGAGGLRWWARGVAAYGSLMLASMSFSYKIMPVAINERQAGRKVSGKLPKADRPAGGKLAEKGGEQALRDLLRPLPRQIITLENSTPLLANACLLTIWSARWTITNYRTQICLNYIILLRV